MKRADQEMEVIAVPRSTIPKGAKLVEAYETEHRIIVVGYPSENSNHNCDAMGCTSVSHVIYRFTKPDRQ